MTFQCPSCHAEIEGDVSPGDSVECPGCGAGFKVPAAQTVHAFRKPVIEIVEEDGGFFRRNRHRLALACGIVAVITAVSVAAVFATAERSKTDWYEDRPGFATSRTEQPQKSHSSGGAVVRSQNPTESEKMAMGRVFYVYAKQEILMSQIESQAGNDAIQLLTGMAAFKILDEVDTTGCPKDFADAWKEFANGVSMLKTTEGGYKMMTQAFSLARMRGQPIDRDFAAKLLEMERKMPEVRRECEEKMKAFATVCRRYGLDNLQQWAKEAYIMNEGNPDAKLFKSDK